MPCERISMTSLRTPIDFSYNEWKTYIRNKQHQFIRYGKILPSQERNWPWCLTQGTQDVSSRLQRGKSRHKWPFHLWTCVGTLRMFSINLTLLLLFTHTKDHSSHSRVSRFVIINSKTPFCCYRIIINDALSLSVSVKELTLFH